MTARDLPAQAALPDLFIDALARVEPGAVLGPRCVVKAGAVVCRGTVVGAGVTIGANAVFVDPDEGIAAATVGDGAQIGPAAVIHAGVAIGAGARVRPGTVVTRSVPPGAIVDGNPAAITGYVDALPQALQTRPWRLDDRGERVVATPVRGVTVHNMPLHADLRGDLTVGEFLRDVPFAPQRYFIVFGVPNRELRGEHAHRVCEQFLICVRGSCSVVADDGHHKVEVALDGPQRGLYLPAMTWGIQYKHSPDAILLVFASHHYDGADYIRQYAEFLAEAGTKIEAAVVA